MKLFATLALATLWLFAASQEDYYFPPNTPGVWESVTFAELGWCEDPVPDLLSMLENEGTKAFILLHKGRIVMENYMNGHDANANWYWASAGKTLTAFAVGMAQQNGLLDITQPSASYLGAGWTSLSPEEEQAVTVWHHLTMTTGFDDSLDDLNCTDPECLEFLAEPGTRWSYHNAPYTLLTNIVENTSGTGLNQFVGTNIGTPIGMSGLYIPIDNMRVFFSRARDMARFGHLMLSNGAWNGTPVMTDAQFFTAMTVPSQNLNPSYGYLWWLNGQQTFMVPSVPIQLPGSIMPNAPDDLQAALGANAQLINVVPSMDVVLIRMGENPEGVPVPFLHNDAIWTYLNQIICNEVNVRESEPLAEWAMYPNPARDLTNMVWPSGTHHAIVYHAESGQRALEIRAEGPQQAVPLSLLSPGTYAIACYTASGALTGQVQRLIVQP